MPQRASKHSRRRSYGTKKTHQKAGDKATKWSPKTKSKQRLLAKKAIINERLAALQADEPELDPEDDEQSTRDVIEYENQQPALG